MQRPLALAYTALSALVPGLARPAVAKACSMPSVDLSEAIRRSDTLQLVATAYPHLDWGTKKLALG